MPSEITKTQDIFELGPEDTEDPRLHRTMRIGLNEQGWRFVDIDGITFPTFTKGAITVTECRTGAYKDSKGVWPAHEDDEYLLDTGNTYAYEVNLTCFVDKVIVDDPSALEERHPC